MAFSIIPSVPGGLKRILGPGATWSEGDAGLDQSSGSGEEGDRVRTHCE